MSREGFKINDNITLVTGSDHALGQFAQIYDSRTEEKFDEGLIFDWDGMFGFTRNHIGWDKFGKPDTSIPLLDKDGIIEYCDKFLESEAYKNEPTVEQKMKEDMEAYEKAYEKHLEELEAINKGREQGSENKQG